ncbi:carboxyltransferase domain-containing protein, partial [Nonomuraea lactucae]|uniref:carboxyltransferase domain-containing protein n=1 Tax=Nonomuraea lactucae TaxID=2249762 RepID=UPI0013B46205
MTSLRRFGDTALLVELDGLEEVVALYDSLTAEPVPGVTDILPAARTLLIRFARPADAGAVESAVESAVRAARPA